jgi:hypothetical protein
MKTPPWALLVPAIATDGNVAVAGAASPHFLFSKSFITLPTLTWKSLTLRLTIFPFAAKQGK